MILRCLQQKAQLNLRHLGHHKKKTFVHTYILYMHIHIFIINTYLFHPDHSFPSLLFSSSSLLHLPHPFLHVPLSILPLFLFLKSLGLPVVSINHAYQAASIKAGQGSPIGRKGSQKQPKESETAQAPIVRNPTRSSYTTVAYMQKT